MNLLSKGFDWKEPLKEPFHSRSTSVFTLRSIVLVGVAVLLGCGTEGHQLETAPVKGTVKLDGEPLASGYVFILPSKGRMAKGSIQSDGTFVMSTYQERDGVQVGEHPVIVTPIPLGEGTPRPKSKTGEIPDNYMKANTSGLSISVHPGDTNQLDIELTSKNS